MGLRINAEVINAFLTPALEQLRNLAGTNTALERLVLTQKLPPASITMRIDLHGGLEGATYWSFDLALAKHVAHRMLPPCATKDLQNDMLADAMLTDAVAELTNIIVGHASGSLLESGYRVQFLPPCPESVLLCGNAIPNLVVLTPAGRAQILLQLQIVSLFSKSTG